MIELFRIDERLIHGQVAISWAKTLKITHIILINDEIVHNEMQILTLQMAVPSGVKFLIKDIEKGVQLLKDPRICDIRLMVVVSNPLDALRIAKGCKNISAINLGNYGLFPSKDGKIKEELASTIRVNDVELQALRNLDQMGIELKAQLTPDSAKKNINQLIKEV